MLLTASYNSTVCRLNIVAFSSHSGYVNVKQYYLIIHRLSCIIYMLLNNNNVYTGMRYFMFVISLSSQAVVRCWFRFGEDVVYVMKYSSYFLVFPNELWKSTYEEVTITFFPYPF